MSSEKSSDVSNKESISSDLPVVKKASFDVYDPHNHDEDKRGSSFRRRTMKDSAANKLRQTFLVLNGQVDDDTEYNTVAKIMLQVWFFPVLFSVAVCCTPQASPFDSWDVRKKYIANMIVPNIVESIAVAGAFIEFADVVVIKAACGCALSWKEKVGFITAASVGGMAVYYLGYFIFATYPPFGFFWCMIGTFNVSIFSFGYLMWFHGYYSNLESDDLKWESVKSSITVIVMFLLCGMSAITYFILAAIYRMIEDNYRDEDGSVGDEATLPLGAFSLIFVFWKEMYYCISVRVYNATNPAFIPIGQTWLLFCHSFFMAIVLSSDDTKNAVILLLVLLDLMFCLYAILRILREQQALFFNESELKQMVDAISEVSDSDSYDNEEDLEHANNVFNNNNDDASQDDAKRGPEHSAFHTKPTQDNKDDENEINNDNNEMKNKDSTFSTGSRRSSNNRRRSSKGSTRRSSKFGRSSRTSRRSRAKSKILSTNLGKNVALMFTQTNVAEKKKDKDALIAAADKMVTDGSGYVKHGMYLVVSEFTETFVPMIYLCVVLSLNWLPTRDLIGGYGADVYGWTPMTNVTLNIISLCKLIVLEAMGLLLVMYIMYKTFRIHLIQAWFLHCHDFGDLMVCFAVTTLMIPLCLSFIPFGMDITLELAWIGEENINRINEEALLN